MPIIYMSFILQPSQDTLKRIVIEEGRNYEITRELDPPCLCKSEELENTQVEEVHY